MDLKDLDSGSVALIRFLVTMERDRRLRSGYDTDRVDGILERIEAAEEYRRICRACSEEIKAGQIRHGIRKAEVNDG